ncbi:MAG: KamA family radical SAM protein [Spirochaetaceae bacterium]|nr:KamA family radical SAM protein [Spirochaetaceae bacterium]
MEESWQEAMRGRIRTLPTLSEQGSERGRDLPFAATHYWLSLADEDYRYCRRDTQGVPLDPILAQALPSPAERKIAPIEMKDPLHEQEHGQFPRMIHQYSSRILLRTTGDCPVFCRYCFRRSLLPGDKGFMDEAAQENARLYLASHPEIREVLVSGGDPLSASNEKLESLFSRLRAGRKEVQLRLCTRAPVTLPVRIDAGLVDLLARYKPLHMVIHVNHPREITPLFRERIGWILAAGIPVRSQTVLLRGINDKVDTLVELFSTLAQAGIDPYYLFQGDLAQGTAHFRIPLSRGLLLYDALRQRLSGIEMPRFAVDAPDGGGKLYLPESVLRLEEGFWVLRTPDGKLHSYPEEPEELDQGRIR